MQINIHNYVDKPFIILRCYIGTYVHINNYSFKSLKRTSTFIF